MPEDQIRHIAEKHKLCPFSNEAIMDCGPPLAGLGDGNDVDMLAVLAEEGDGTDSSYHEAGLSIIDHADSAPTPKLLTY
ncbi:hypothetical protein EMCG_09126 [[Emmonsia] crescens]|uniref:Uncharacterized protein n=1 Tax=[Emmonsia] crescens TaxID=73230 RepID=A0A0G2I439_9EURO|nr:hypothetical protein EMCG_09126 [Emmonsia crescens UAMH 3008]